MHRCQPLPCLWMMTDERQGSGLLGAVERLPRGAGIVFRHYRLPVPERRNLFLKVRSAARRRDLVLMLAGEPRLAEAWGADGSHGLAGGRASSRNLLRSAAVHNVAELKSAARAGADFVFVSPVFPTRSHPGAPALGPVRFGLLVREARVPVIALGGMSVSGAQKLAGLNVYGWAAIDALTAD